MTMVNITVAEYERNEAMAAVVYPMELAGATVLAVPVFETAVGREATAEEKYRK